VDFERRYVVVGEKYFSKLKDKGDAMFGLGTTELMVIFGIAVLIFGGKKLPEIGAGLGKGITSFKKGLREVEEPVKEAQREMVEGDSQQN
jgi:sec-independent protein translocase protein TatA